MKKLLRTIIPEFLRPIAYCKWYVKQKTNLSVYSGPFQGMKYITKSIGSALYPKLFGTYEMELHPVFEQVLNQTFENIYVIGAGEGYYPVGLAMKLDVKVTAYESSPEGRELINQLAAENKLKDQVIINGECVPESLLNLKSGEKNLFIFDIEGEEIDFFKEDVFHYQNKSWFIVEIHYLDHLTRFKETLGDQFEIDFIPVMKRNMSDLPISPPAMIEVLFRRYWSSLLQEWRTSNSYGWLILKPK